MNTSTVSTFIAKFNPLIRPYLVITIGFTIAITIIGLPFALIWFLGVGQWWARHYFAKLECHLDEKALRYRKGIFVQVEKTIPLENIQDVTFIEGTILRYFHLSTLKFETAGHSAGQANMHLTGIMDAHEFRNKIFEARDALKQKSNQSRESGEIATSQSHDVATGQLAALQSIDRRMEEIITLLKARN